MIQEPMTVATDGLLWVLTWFLAWRLLMCWRHRGERSIGLWAGGFAASGLAALLGGIAHGAAGLLSSQSGFLVWWATCASIGGASLFFAATLVELLCLGPTRYILQALLVVKCLAFLIWIAREPKFLFVILDYLPVLLAILVVSLWMIFRQAGEGWAAWLAWGVICSLLAAVIQASGLSLHRNFNHNDLYHLFQAVAFYLLYRGGMQLRDRQVPAT